MTFTVEDHKLADAAGPVAFIGSPNIGGALKPQFLVMHYTASGPEADIAHYFAAPERRVSAHLVVRRDGSVTQCVAFDTVAWHAGKSQWRGRGGRHYVGLNRHAIGIELENWGPLRYAEEGYVSWTGAVVPGDRVVLGRHKFGTPDGGWECFPQAQVETAAAAATAICEAYGIEEIIGHDDIAPGRKSDPGPAWDMAAFRTRVRGEAAATDANLVVRAPSGLNLRTGAGLEFALAAPRPLPEGTRVLPHEADGKWRFVTVPDATGMPIRSGWVHGDWLGPD